MNVIASDLLDSNEYRDVAEELCQGVDWSKLKGDLPEARRTTAFTPESATALIALLRHRRNPDLGYSPSYVARLRSSTDDNYAAAASQKIDDTLTMDLVLGHSNPLARMGATDLILGADENRWWRVAEWVMKNRADWDHGAWGLTRSIIDVLRVMFPHPECPDGAIVPLFGWLIAQLPAEWEWARNWDADMLGSAGHNWWLHTFLGFWQAGLYFPEISDWGKFQAFAPDYFERELSVLMEGDGFTKERSGYQWGTVRHFLNYLHVASANDIRGSSEFRKHLRKVAETLWKVRAPNGDVPRHGDCGKTHEVDDRLEDLRKVAALFDMPEAKYVAERLAAGWEPELASILPGHGRDLMPEYLNVDFRAPSLPTADTELEDSGYYVMRENWTPQSDWMCLEAGSIGPIVTSHNHTHQGNFELYSRGRPVLIDNCSGPYGDSPERRWRVCSAAHNVATVDGMDHLPIQNQWRWSGQLHAFVENWRKAKDYVYFNAAHEGYRHLDEPVASARRKVFYLRGEYWILLDRFVPETNAEHEYTQHFQVGVSSQLEGKRLITRGPAGNLLIVPLNKPSVDAQLESCPYPLDDHENPDHLTYTINGAGRQIMGCILVPFVGEECPEVSVEEREVEADGRTLQPWEATALEITRSGRRDVYVDLHMAWNLPWKVGDHHGQSRLYHSWVK